MGCYPDLYNYLLGGNHTIMTNDLIGTFVAGLVTAAAAIVLNLINERLSRRGQAERRKIEDVLAAVEAKAEEAKAKVMESLAERVTPGSQPAEIAEKLASQFRIGGDVIVNQVVKEGSGFIEELVSGYHHQALSQAKVQFWFSIIAATVGFAYILFSAASAGL